MRSRWKVPACIIGLLVLSACQPAAPSEALSGAAPTALPAVTKTALVRDRAFTPTWVAVNAVTPQTSAPDPTQAAAEDPMLQKMLDLAKAQLAQEIGMPADQIALVDAQAVTWRDASLGCQKPGIDYIQVETPGFTIRLRARGQVYTFHTDQSRRVVHCEVKPKRP